MSLFLESIIAFLMPYFTVTTIDMEAARAEIIETLASYATRTRAEMLQAAQIIALGMTTLDTLAEAKAADLSPSMLIRFRGCANNLNRSTLQTEKALEQRLAANPPEPEAEPASEPVNDLPDPDVQGAIDHARATIAAHRQRATSPQRATTARPTPAQPDQNKQIWAGAMIDTLRQMGFAGAPPQPATASPPC